MAFNGDRLRIARVYRGLKQGDLAKLVAASPALISHYETERKAPKGELLAALAHVLDFERDFFMEPLEDEFREEECSFRRQTAAPVGIRKLVLARATLFGMALSYLGQRLRLPRFDVPAIRVHGSEDIERAAETCRDHWRLGLDRPITSMGRVLENAGVALTQLNADSAKVDAFSRHGEFSVVVLNTSKGSASRSIFDMAHELGHLVMHRAFKPGSPEREREAQRFAAAFLLPSKAFTREFWSRGRVDWAHMFELKRRWRTSVAALVHRAYELSLLDAASYRRAFKFIYARGWHRGEPEEPDPERPELMQIAFAKLKKDHGESPLDVADALHWRPQTLTDVTGIDVSPPNQRALGVVSLESYRQKKAG